MFALPNALTILRIVLVPIFVVAFVLPGEVARLVAFAVFALAGVSETLAKKIFDFFHAGG